MPDNEALNRQLVALRLTSLATAPSQWVATFLRTTESRRTMVRLRVTTRIVAKGWRLEIDAEGFVVVGADKLGAAADPTRSAGVFTFQGLPPHRHRFQVSLRIAGIPEKVERKTY